jgi:hypothetical protein
MDRAGPGKLAGPKSLAQLANSSDALAEARNGEVPDLAPEVVRRHGWPPFVPQEYAEIKVGRRPTAPDPSKGRFSVHPA